MKQRFTDEAQIIKKIDQCYEQHAELLVLAEQDEKLGAHDWAARRRAQAERLIEVRAKKLGRRLAEFRTKILPGIVDDETLPVKLK